MAFFNFRWPGQGEQAEKPAKRSRSAQAESIEVMRRRARHRLIGAAVLVLVGVVGFPLLFDTQPRPIPVDIPIEIPDRNKVAPLVVPAATSDPAAARPSVPSTKAPGAVVLSQAPERSVAGAGLGDGEDVASSRSAAKPASAASVASKAVAQPEVKPKPIVVPEPKPEPKPKPDPKPSAPEPKPSAADDSARARALLEGRTVQPAAGAQAEDGRFIVQVGAFADADKAREARTKLERAGLKTYTQVVDTKDGKRVRVRVGPLASRADAEKAANRIKGLGLSASVLTL
ncbi:MAG: SPOR domain-containing protein [Comamonadaceae bacterium]|jgi:DedD protein|nr:SPOR domain-containing protein [Comamonadaceae bacterium]